VLALVALHAAAHEGPSPAQPSLRAATRQLAPLLPTDETAALGVTAAVHAATSLRAGEPPAALAAQAPASGVLPPSSITLPSVAAAAADVLHVIAGRRSVRRFAATPLAMEALSGVLAHMARRHPPMLSSAVRVDVVAHAVEGIPPGSYRYEPARHALLPRRAPAELRAAARAAALEQDVIGAAAAVFILSIDRAAFAADPLGPARGYRHAFLEAGLMGERIYLEAGARGLGACAVGAFYDDEAATLVAVDPSREWVLHFAALGVLGSQ